MLRRAVQLQRAVVESEGSRASKTICSAVLPKYKGLVQNVAEKLRALSDALAAERELRESLLDGGVSPGAGGLLVMRELNQMRLDGQDDYTLARLWMKDAKESALL